MTDRRSNNLAETISDGEEDLRPVVAKKQSNLSLPLFAGGLVILAALLFIALDANRRALNAPATRAVISDLEVGSSQTPQLYIPQDFSQGQPEPIVTPPELQSALPISQAATAPAAQSSSEPQIIYQSVPDFPTEPVIAPSRAQDSGPVLVFDRNTRQSSGEVSAGGEQSASARARLRGTTRVRAGQLSNPETTVVRGTVIPVVLETALNSTQAGQARAIVSRDVYGFTGRNVLVPRGSRLIGEYESDLAAGQNRILVQWVRLLRPDGATIDLDSGSADRLGRAGVRGKVNSHFFERFGNAILRTSLDVGAILATRQISDGVIVALPNSVREVAAPNSSDEVRRTLTVKHGAALSVFVARDLDFTPVERAR